VHPYSRFRLDEIDYIQHPLDVKYETVKGWAQRKPPSVAVGRNSTKKKTKGHISYLRSSAGW
jgi:hypothetical protein